MSKTNIIKSIEVVFFNQTTRIYQVGNNEIEIIKDASTEWDSGLEIMYDCYNSKNKLLVTINNCPCIVTYK